MRVWQVLTFCAIAVALSASDISAKENRQVTAANGVVVSINGDAFDGKLEFTAPPVKSEADGGTSILFLVAITRPTGKEPGRVEVQGFLSYSGDWRQYDGANFRGGEAAKFSVLGRDVGSCRYGCSLTETFGIVFTDEQISKYAIDGVLELKLKAKSSSHEPVIQIPLNYIQAVREVASATST